MWETPLDYLTRFPLYNEQTQLYELLSSLSTRYSKKLKKHTRSEIREQSYHSIFPKDQAER